MSDEYYGESETSSLKSETDLVLCKRNTDIHVTGSAHAPSGDKSQWKACVRVNSFSKELSLSGVRYLQYERNRWQMSLPDKIINVPLRYELAYGGIWQPDGMEKLVFSANPVGCGYYPDISQLNTSCQYKLPQITSSALSENATIFNGESDFFQGVGPVSRWWKSRLQYAGTYNEVWREKRYPYLPDDFDERFYNSAHPDMIYTGFLSGDENISLEGFFKFEQVVKTKLPGIRPVLILKTKNNTSHMFLPVADTMVIDLSRQEIYLTWRLTIPDFFGMKEGVLSCIIPECIGKKYYG
ncbi:hypothetical protein HmCmsJML165_01711 [Escherichia coli]|nr:hypothetical protein HmCmsJML165_01711 [Escherichia coli]